MLCSANFCVLLLSAGLRRNPSWGTCSRSAEEYRLRHDRIGKLGWRIDHKVRCWQARHFRFGKWTTHFCLLPSGSSRCEPVSFVPGLSGFDQRPHGSNHKHYYQGKDLWHGLANLFLWHLVPNLFLWRFWCNGVDIRRNAFFSFTIVHLCALDLALSPSRMLQDASFISVPHPWMDMFVPVVSRSFGHMRGAKRICQIWMQKDAESNILQGYSFVFSVFNCCVFI